MEGHKFVKRSKQNQFTQVIIDSVLVFGNKLAALAEISCLEVTEPLPPLWPTAENTPRLSHPLILLLILIWSLLRMAHMLLTKI